MMRLIVTILASIMMLVLSSCNKPDKSVVQPSAKVLVDSRGYKYRLVSPEKVLPGGMIQAELWERFDPLETNHWYTPTLSSKYDTNSPTVFNSLMR